MKQANLRKAQDVDRRVAAALGDAALHHDVPVEDAAHGVRHGLVVVVALHEHGEQPRDRPLPRARPGPLEEARQLLERRQALSAGVALTIDGEASKKPGFAGVSEGGE